MNILPRNQAEREAKSPCDKNIRYPVCVSGHDSPNATTFVTIVIYDKQKTALVDDPSDLINTRRLFPGRKPLGRPAVSGLSGPETIYSCDQVTWIIHSGGFLIVVTYLVLNNRGPDDNAVFHVKCCHRTTRHWNHKDRRTHSCLSYDPSFLSAK
jgi:hypothetical protein